MAQAKAAQTKTASQAKTAEPKAVPAAKVTKLPSQRVTGHAAASLSTHVQVKATPAVSSASKVRKTAASKKAVASKKGPQVWLWVPLLATDEIVKAKYLGEKEEVFRIRKEDGSFRRSNGAASLVNPTQAQLDKLSKFASEMLAKKDVSKEMTRACKELARQCEKVTKEMAEKGMLAVAAK